MEFHEKLAQLRKARGWTQEELANRLYVSRTAVSKWESGKGYPNIDSLKALARTFDVSIDTLLSGEELLSVAEGERNAARSQSRLKALAYVDLAALSLIILPLYGKTIDGYIYSAMLWAPPDAVLPIRLLYWAIALSLIGLGASTLYALHRERMGIVTKLQQVSLFVAVLATPFFIATGEPYAATLLFLMLLAKGAFHFKHLSTAHRSNERE